MLNKDEIKTKVLQAVEEHVKMSHHAITYRLWEITDFYAKELNVTPAELPVKLSIMRIWKKLDLIAGELTRLHKTVQELRTGTHEPM